MHRTARFASFGPFSRWFPAPLLHLCVVAGMAAALGTGCTLITDVDRSKIPAAEVVPPDPPPPPPADAGEPPAQGDAGSEPDAGGSSEPDAASPPAGDAG